MQEGSYTLRCTIDTVDRDPLLLDITIELAYLLSAPYTVAASVDLTFSASVIFDEVASLALIDDGFDVIDVNSIEITTSLDGATPSMLEASLTNGVNDLDLTLDTDQNGVAGPHRIELDPATTATSAMEGASEVELALALEQISLVLGDVQVPTDCISAELRGFTTRFPVRPSD